MLEKVTVIDRIEVLEDGSLQVRRASYITENGVPITERTYQRVAYEPGADITPEHARVKTVATAMWTPDVVEAAAQKRRANEAVAAERAGK